MPRPFPPDVLAAVDALAASQDGLIRRAQLVQLGVSRSGISRLTRSGGPWQRLLPATYFVPRSEPTPRDRELAALMYAGADSVLTGHATLRHCGMRYAPSESADPTLHALIPYERTVASRGFVRIERTKRMPTPLLLHGVRLAPLPRALFDATRHCSDQRLVRAVLMEALQNRRVTPAQIEAEFDAGQRRWTALARDVVREFRTGSASAPEAELRQTWESRSLPPMTWNATLLSHEGEFIAETDAYDDSCGMALEMESREFHSGLRWDQGLARLRLLASYGIVVVPVTPQQFRSDPDQVLREILAVRASLHGRPPPPVRVVARYRS